MSFWDARRTDLPRFSPYPIAFDTEREAVEYVVGFLRPYCVALALEPVLEGSSLRPDIGIRLRELRDIRLAIEVKKFTAPVDGRMRNISTLIDAIRQAHSYSELTGNIALVGPIRAHSISDFMWLRSPMGTAALIASEFSVGMLYMDGDCGGIYIGDQAAVRFNGNGAVSIHPKAETLLKKKHFSGSKTWRDVA